MKTQGGMTGIGRRSTGFSLGPVARSNTVEGAFPVRGQDRLGPPRRSGQSVLLAFGTIVLESLLSGTAARAQRCNLNPNPSAPAPITYDVPAGNYSSDSAPAFLATNFGLAGCNGQTGTPGQPGLPGLASPGFTSTSNSVSLTGSFLVVNPFLDKTQTFQVGGYLLTQGGIGGIGGIGVNGGDGAIGGHGGAAGPINAAFTGSLQPSALHPSSDIGLWLVSLGGSGGAGGAETGTIFDLGPKVGGNAGNAASGGSITLTAGGTIQGTPEALSAESVGGNGGRGGYGDTTQERGAQSVSGNGGNGGNGGSVSVAWTHGQIIAAPSRTNPNAIFSRSAGGDAGNGENAGPVILDNSGTGGNGGNGGNGGAASVLLSGGSLDVTSGGGNLPVAAGIVVQSLGGLGGNGGNPSGSNKIGGSGGNGGAGGSASATVLSAINVISPPSDTFDGQGVLVQSSGGFGGNGASESGRGQAGGGGFAGAGGSASVVIGNAANQGTITVTGGFVQGAVVQSVGGGGGKAGAVSWGGWSADGGAGADGGAAALAAPNALVTVSGINGTAAIVQSIGGGGGIGGDVKALAVAIGGNGGNGGQGGPVNVTLGSGSFQQIGTGGGGILAQSVGGAGGTAGNAIAYSGGAVSFAIGGVGGAGGGAGPVTMSNGTLIGTKGDHAAGVTAQSIGGGGGKGGAAFALDIGIGISAAVALGGAGGTGGTGGAVTLTGNTGQIITYGSDAPAVVLQSIGGGGGAGGSAAARAVSFSPDPQVPAISVTFAAGGSGGSGNAAGPVGLTNSGLITTAGDGAIGVIAQSVGGGGGIGGDSTASSFSGGSGASPANLSVTVAMGGQGGTGGTGGNVTLSNSGVLATFGQDAYGVFAQSVGGGGGIAGAGDASASSGKAKANVSATIGLGGTGGVGGAAGQVLVTNAGAITTSGDGSDAVFAQTVGGGGGAGGGGVTTAAGGTLSSSVALGGSGGGGNDGNTTTAQNSGLIITRGTDAIGLSVQSVGGGGGKGGKAGATAGGTTEIGSAGALFNILSKGLGLSQTFNDLGNGFVRIGRDGERIVATADQLSNILSQPQAGAKEIGTAVQLNVAVGVGGGGGGGGEGGVVSATNTGLISTFGAQSDGIYAQSVGGGGGSAGSATSTAAAATDTPVQTAIAVGGTGGSGGDGGPVTVVNGPGGAILTQGVAAVGIFAQSVGGGGGEGAAAGSVSGLFKSLSASLGGNGGTGGFGGPVSVTTGDGGSTIATTGKHGIGILAQSVGGGGGVVRTMTTDMTFDPAKLFENQQGRIGDYHGLDLTFGGRNGVVGSGGKIEVTTSGAITTSGLDAHAILAQSVGGGGGLALGGQALATYVPPAPPTRLTRGGGPAGDGGEVTVNLKPGTVIQTQGAGAYGVLAQSIGGGGGVFGDLSQSNSCFLICIGTNFLESVVTANVGNGGNVTVTASGAQVRTSGANATGIFAQSVGGGGGLGAINVTSEVNFVDVRAGTVNGGGAAGSVGVSLVNSSVVTSGATSTGILAQSAGSAPGSVTISIDANSLVEATTGVYAQAINPGAAILILDGTSNRINNAGVISARGPDGQYSSGVAIQTNTSASQTTIVNTAQINGNTDLNNTLINLLANRNLLDNRVGGVLNAPTALQLGGGLLQNVGTLHVGGIGTIGRTVLTGDLVQGATGVLRIDTNALTGKADLLEIRGKAELAGTIRVDAVGLRKGETDPIVTASGGLTLRSAVAGAALPVFTQTAVLRGNTLTVATDAAFGADDASKSRNQRGLTGALQRIWDGGLPGFEQGFAGLARLPDERAYRQALDSLSGEVHGSAITTQAQTAFFVQEAILDRLRFGGGEGAIGVPQLGLTGSIGTRFAPGTTLPSAYSADRPGGPAVSEVPVPPAASGYAVWGQAFGAFGETASNGNAGRLDRQISGFVLGAETGAGVLADWRIGLAAGYSLATFDVPARQSYGSVESGFGAVYARGAYGPLQLRLGAAYTGSALDTRRTVSVPGLSGTATGRSGGDTVQGFGEVGYRFAFGQGYIEPFAGAATLRIRRDGFTERGGPAALTVFGRSYEIGTATAGLQGQAALAPLLGIDLPIVARGLIGYRDVARDMIDDGGVDACLVHEGRGAVSEGVEIEGGLVEADILPVASERLGVGVTQTPVGAPALQLREKAQLSRASPCCDLVEQAEADQLHVDRNAPRGRPVLELAHAFLINVEKPNPLFLLHIGDVQLADLLLA